jgi:hypothetical protein
MGKTTIEWRSLPGFSDYEISSDGNVRRATPGKSTRVERLLKPQVEDGYFILMIQRRKVRLNSAVLEAFRGLRPIGCEARHLDGNRQILTGELICKMQQINSVTGRNNVGNDQERRNSLKLRSGTSGYELDEKH